MPDKREQAQKRQQDETGALSNSDRKNGPPTGWQTVIDAIAQHANQTQTTPPSPGLYLVATPIGNLSDITLRALQVLAHADVIYCEDTRHSRTLMDRFQIKTPLKPYHEHNAARQRPGLLRALSNGACIALVSDAGTPLISDPGFKLVREALNDGHQVITIPGPTAGLAAATASGLPTDKLMFAGFLPTRQAARRMHIAALAAVEATLIFYEAPHRIKETLADLLRELGDRAACLARELTKMHEDLRRETLSTLLSEVSSQAVKGECVILVGPPEKNAPSDSDITARLEVLLGRMSLKDAARTIAEETSVAKSHAYDLGLALKRRSDKA